MLAGPVLGSLPADVRQAIARDGLRNGLLTSIAPTGTISLLAGNVSSGIEPVFDVAFERRVLEQDGSPRMIPVADYAYAAFRRARASAAPLSDAFVTADDLDPQAHLDMQAAAQRHVDSAISKTINCPADIPFEAFESIYLDAYAKGLKGVTTFRPNAITGTVLSRPAPAAATSTSSPRATRRSLKVLPPCRSPSRRNRPLSPHARAKWSTSPSR